MKAKLILLTGASLLAAPAMAQTTSAPPQDSGLADIVVTAQKREQNLQNVPVAVTALGSETLQNQRINEFGDLKRAAASLTLTESTASPNNSIVLRGIGTFAFSIGVEPSVAVIVDDVPVVQQAQAFDNLSDVERIEVLRGPQGTLFGKNASAGAINIVTKDPGKDLAFTATLQGTTDRSIRGDASVSVPLGETAGLRVSGYYGGWDGNVTNLANGSRLNGNTNYGIRAKIKAKVSPSITLSLIGGYSKLTQTGTAATLRSINLNYIPPGQTVAVIPRFAGVSILPNVALVTPGSGNFAAVQDNDSPTSNEQANVSGKINFDLGFATLISVTSYQDWKYNFSADVDQTNLNVAGVAGAFTTNPVGPAQGVNQSGPYHSTEFTQELRLVSSGGGPLKYVIGAFYANAATSRNFTRGPTLLLANWQGYQGTRSIAGFAQVDYTLPSETTLSGGIRVNNERVQDNFVNLLPNATVFTAFTNAATAGSCGAGSANCAGRNVDTAITWKASVQQQLAPKVSVYASVATGYKGFAYDISSGYSPFRTIDPVKPERSTSYEIGIKSRFFDNRLQLNVTGFLSNYNNFQAQSAQFINGALQNKLNNVGKLRTQGVEVELLAKPTSWLNIDGSAAYTDAKVVSFVDAACYTGQGADQALAGRAPGSAGINFCGPSLDLTKTGNFQDRSGSQLPNSPKFKFTLGATVNVPVGADTKATFGLNYQHQSAVSFDLLGNPLLIQSAYGVLNGSIGFEHGPFKVTAFVNNLFDQQFAAGLGDSFGTYGTHAVFQVVPRDSQRYFGLKVGVHF